MPEVGKRRYVAVIGPGTVTTAQESAWAEDVGRLLASEGVVVVCGGMTGVMESVAKGASSAGGMVIGILPGERRETGNAYLSVAIPTDMGHARNAIVVRTGDAVIAVGGEWGTLSEIGLALKMGKPVIGLGTWELSKGGMPRQAIEMASDAKDAVARALARIRR